jgi:RimJ/RimL family protein N-acetyltransferase
MSLIIRAATSRDAEECLRLRLALLGETPYMLYEPTEISESVDDERDRIARLTRTASGLYYIAVSDDDVVGILNGFTEEPKRRQHSMRLALGVRNSHWGRGIGTLLMKQAFTSSAEAGIVRLEAIVHAANHRALSLWLRLGFHFEGTRRWSLLIDGSYADEYMLARVQPLAP